MPKLAIRPISFTDLSSAPNFRALIEEYTAESALAELGGPDAQIATYLQIESTGALRLLGAFEGDHLVGFLIMLVSVLPHFGKCVASTESFFVTDSARSSGAGLKLLRAAEALAAESGAMGFFVSAPIGSRLDKVLSAKRYRETNRVFFRVLA